MSEGYKLELNDGKYVSDLLDPFFDAVLTPLTDVEIAKHTADHIKMMKEQLDQEVDEAKAEAEIRKVLKEEHENPTYCNRDYQVSIRQCDKIEGWYPMLHLSIKRRDKNPIDVNHWRILQEIKNMLIGPEHEAVELYPADERVVDMANQYHLWVMSFPCMNAVFPFGFFGGGKLTSDSKGAENVGAKQRDRTSQG
jgi:hypothetical protein